MCEKVSANLRYSSQVPAAAECKKDSSHVHKYIGKQTAVNEFELSPPTFFEAMMMKTFAV